MLQIDDRESSYVDENDRFLIARVARLENVAIAETDRRIACYLIEIDDPAALRLKARRRLFSFEAGDSTARGNWRFHPASPPDIWCNMAVTTLMLRLDSRG